MRKHKTIFYSALMLTGVNLLLRTAGTSFQVYLSSRIGANGIGLLQLVLSVSGFATTIGMAGIRTTAMYLTAEEIGKKRKQNILWVLSGAFTYSIVISTAVALGLYFTAPLIASHWLGSADTIPAIRLFAAFLPVSCMCGIMTGYFTAANRIGTLAAVEVTEQICTMTLTVLLLQLWANNDPGRACQAVIFGGCIGSCITLSCLTFLRLKERAVSGARIPIAKRLLHTALPLGLSDDLRTGISTIENLMVPKRLALYGGTQTPLALFGMVCGMVFPILMFPCAILFGLTELLVPEMARCNAAGSRKRIAHLMQKSLKLVLLYGCFCAGLEFVLADNLCLSLYHSEEAGLYLRLYAPLIVMLYADIVIDAMIKGLGQQTASVRYNILTSALDVALLFVLLPRYGMYGYFASFLVTHAINFLLSIRRLVKITGQKLPLTNAVCCITSGISAAAVAFAIPGTALKILVFTTVYAIVLSLLKVVKREDLYWILALIKGK